MALPRACRPALPCCLAPQVLCLAVRSDNGTAMCAPCLQAYIELLRLPDPQVLRLVVRLYEGVPQPDYAAICQCLMFLDDADEVAAIVARLLGWVPWLSGGLGQGVVMGLCSLPARPPGLLLLAQSSFAAS